MSYSSNLTRESIRSVYLAVITLRRYVKTGWTQVSAPLTKYKTDFTYGNVTAVYYGLEAQAEDVNSDLYTADWYFDTETQELFLDIEDDPTGEEIVVEYELFFGTFDANWYRDPTDDTSLGVYFEPIIVQTPQISVNSSQVLVGYLPTSSSSLVLSNATHTLEPHIYDSSFNNARVDIYHCLGKQSTDNFKKIFSGNVGGDIAYTDSTVTLSVLDAGAAFESEFRIVDITTTENNYKSFYTSVGDIYLSPEYENRPIRKVYGVLDNFVAVNSTYQEGVTGVTSANDRWFLGANEDTDTEGYLEVDVVANGSASTTKTYVESAYGFNVDDDITFFRSGSPEQYAVVTAINTTGDHYIEHSAIGSAIADTYSVIRSKVGWVKVIQDNVAYRISPADYSDDIYTSNGYRLDYILIESTAGVDTPLDISTFDPTTDSIICRYYGSKAIAEVSGAAFGGDSQLTGNLSNAVGIIYDLLRLRMNIPESDINTTNFASMLSSVDVDLGFSVPDTSFNDFPVNKDILINVLKSSLLRLYKDDDNLWSLSKITTASATATKTIGKDEILKGSFSYNFDFQDVYSDVYVQYAKKEITETSTEPSYTVIRKTSDAAKNLHKVKKQITITTYHFDATQANDFATKMSAIFGDRQGSISFETKHRFFDTEVGDVINISKERSPGFAFISGTNNDRLAVVTGFSKDRDRIKIDLTDQKGIEDNSGDF